MQGKSLISIIMKLICVGVGIKYEKSAFMTVLVGIITYLNLERKVDYIIPDCIDIQVEVSALKYSQLSSASSGEPSSEIRKRVIAARQIQENRYREYPGIHCNAQMTDRLLHQYCVMDEETNSTLQLAMERLHLSARAYSRILKVARTIADLEGKENIQMHHIAEAIGYRNLDRGDWAERGI